MPTQTIKQEQEQTQSVIPQLAQNGALLLFGALILFAVGFLPMEAAHNAAHDTRHLVAFPCH